MRRCYDAALAAGRPMPTNQARLPLARPDYGRWFAGVCKSVGMHLGVPVWLVRLAFAASAFVFGAGIIT
ncbi:MAG TPA: histidine kinase, partial [Bifidobacterium sp.]|nr:histidine kinase [Bifidobacterium sp.]